MHDYYRIRPVADGTSPDARALERDAVSTLESYGTRRSGVRGFDDDAASGDHCFADDIIVDFPSVQEAVARIRASFLAS